MQQALDAISVLHDVRIRSPNGIRSMLEGAYRQENLNNFQVVTMVTMVMMVMMVMMEMDMREDGVDNT